MNGTRQVNSSRAQAQWQQCLDLEKKLKATLRCAPLGPVIPGTREPLELQAEGMVLTLGGLISTVAPGLDLRGPASAELCCASGLRRG